MLQKQPVGTVTNNCQTDRSGAAAAGNGLIFLTFRLLGNQPARSALLKVQP